MLVVTYNIFLLVRVETVIRRCAVTDLSVGSTSWQVVISSVFDTLVHVEEIDGVVLHDLSLLALPEEWA